jgi:hypothetical protein
MNTLGKKDNTEALSSISNTTMNKRRKEEREGRKEGREGREGGRIKEGGKEKQHYYNGCYKLCTFRQFVQNMQGVKSGLAAKDVS